MNTLESRASNMVSCVQSLFMQMGMDGAINDPFQPRNGADSDLLAEICSAGVLV